MEASNAVERIIRDLLVFVVAMNVVLGALMVIIFAHAERQSAGRARPPQAKIFCTVQFVATALRS